MSDETRDRARLLLARHIASLMNRRGFSAEVRLWQRDADAILAALDAAGIRLAGEGEVVMDAGRANWLLQVAALASVYAGKVNDDLQCWVEHWGDGRCEETKEPQQQAYNDLVQALDKRRPGDLDPIGGSDGNHPREL
jgi:uncharacterized lipoprotein YmbA